ncbi:MAG TPA: N-formylglutamate deformylase [Methylomirabilota bacterium]|nr:N-formylglutamate deformylase [Methylomirabilota bacterium]
MSAFVEIRRGDAPLLVSIPHTGTDIPPEIEGRLVSPWLARKDTDWWIERLYAFADGLGATVVRTPVSRTVIDVNRNPSGAPLYPGMATTELCPTTTFDGEALYRPGEEPSGEEIAERRRRWFDPYHAALDAELARLKARHPTVVVYDCHSIRSLVPRLFDGLLPVFNVGTNGGAAADRALAADVLAIFAGSGRSFVLDGRFKGGWITRRLGAPADGVHAVQMEIACRGYLAETPGPVREGAWPPTFDPDFARPTADVLALVLGACLRFARSCS